MTAVQIKITTTEYQDPAFGWYEIYGDQVALALGAVIAGAGFNEISFSNTFIHANLTAGQTWYYWVRPAYLDRGTGAVTYGTLIALGSILLTGSETFLGLSDTPNAYAGEGGNIVAVKMTEDGLEFIAPSAGAGDFVGPPGATDNHFVQFDLATGKLGKDGGYSPASFDAAGAAAAAQTAAETYADSGDAATLASANSYADAIAQGLSIRDSCLFSTTAALPANVYSNGASGVGATLTAVATGTLTVDGVVVALGNRILVKNEVAGANNGIYVVTTAGAIGVLYVLTRAADYNQSADIFEGTYTFISEGTANVASGFVMTTSGAITVGTTVLSFTQFSGASGGITQLTGDITAGPGSGSQPATIANDAVTYAKMQNISATSRVLGLKSAGPANTEELTFSEVLDFVGSAAQGDVLFRGTALWSRLAAGTSGYVLTTLGTGADPAWSAPGSITVLPDAVSDAQWFGDGSDGDLTASSGTTTLTRDTYYNNVTLSGTGKIVTANFRLYIKGTLDITAAGAAAIAYSGNSGATATNATGAARGAVLAAGTLDAPVVATPGATGTSGAGAQATQADSTSTAKIGGQSGTSGAGGAVGATSGGAARAPSALQSPQDSVRRLSIDLAAWNSSNVYAKFMAGGPGSGGASGAGDGVGTGGGGGGGGSAGGMLWVAARTISRGASTAVGCFAAKGGNGGGGANGGSGGTNRGGGGGGAGAGGGPIRIHFRTLTGSTATNAIDATGGDGGAGGNGVGTGIGGDGGGAGGGGPIDLFNFGAGTWTSVTVGSSAAGNAHSSGTGGAAKSATAQQLSL